MTSETFLRMDSYIYVVGWGTQKFSEISSAVMLCSKLSSGETHTLLHPRSHTLSQMTSETFLRMNSDIYVVGWGTRKFSEISSAVMLCSKLSCKMSSGETLLLNLQLNLLHKITAELISENSWEWILTCMTLKIDWMTFEKFVENFHLLVEGGGFCVPHPLTPKCSKASSTVNLYRNFVNGGAHVTLEEFFWQCELLRIFTCWWRRIGCDDLRCWCKILNGQLNSLQGGAHV